MRRKLRDGWAQVRKDVAEIDMGMLQEAMDKRKLGLPNPQLPPSEAKTRMATVQVPPCCTCLVSPWAPVLGLTLSCRSVRLAFDSSLHIHA